MKLILKSLMIIKRIRAEQNCYYKGTFTNSPYRGSTSRVRGGGVCRGIATHFFRVHIFKRHCSFKNFENTILGNAHVQPTIRYNAHSFRTVVDKAFLV